MGLFTSKKFDHLQDLLLDQLRDLYDAEHRILEALPKMIDAAHSQELKGAFRLHLRETENQVRRLETAFRHLNQEPKRESCDAMKGLIKEGDHVLSASGDDAVIDAALIAAAQRVEHYEMAGYGSARAFAQKLGHLQVAELLQETLDEEGETDKKLTDLAESVVNVEAARS